MTTRRPTLRERIDRAPTGKWAVITALVTFLGTGAGFKLIDRLAPRTGETLARIEVRQIETMGKVDAIMRRLDSLTFAFWKAGIRVETNQVGRVSE